MEQHLLEPGLLLNEEGNLMEAGYAYSLVKKYDRTAIKAGKSRIKEWDYYYVGNKHRGIALTIADNSLYTMVSCTLLDFDSKTYIENSKIKAFTFGKTSLPSSSVEGDVSFEDKGLSMKFIKDGDDRRLNLTWPKFKDDLPLRVDIKLVENLNGKSLVIATPFPKKAHFYYNQKINLLSSTGYAKLGEEMIDFSHDTYGTLDWGRGVWTYKNTWFWSSMNVKQDGHEIAWNLGYGFGDTSKASENVLYVDGTAYKLEDVKFDIPLTKKGNDDFMKDWTFRSAKNDIKITFHPLINRHSDTNLLVLRSNQNQVFGIFNGTIRLPDSDKLIHIEDALGFAEKVYNRW
ncbi:MAG: DUF2804 domain-containing protein [Bacilli bacterium]|nr:DUF2804 domain-containing protein [Bacilli bacterium]